MNNSNNINLMNNMNNLNFMNNINNLNYMNNTNNMNFINNMNCLNNMNNINNTNIMNNLYQFNYNHFDVKFIFKGQEIIIKSFSYKTINDLIKKIFFKVGFCGEKLKSLKSIFNVRQLDFNSLSTLAQIGIGKDSKICVLDTYDFNVYNKENKYKIFKITK